jgi:hypothetical protein
MTIAGEEQAGQILNQDALGRVLITSNRPAIIEMTQHSNVRKLAFFFQTSPP